MHHGYEKLMAFSSMKDHFMSFMHMGSTVTLSLVIFTEFFCAAMVILGLFTRFACLAIVIEFIYAFIVIHQAKPFAQTLVQPSIWNGEPALLYLTGFLALLLCGPGKVSVDGMISK